MQAHGRSGRQGSPLPLVRPPFRPVALGLGLREVVEDVLLELRRLHAADLLDKLPVLRRDGGRRQ